jgi:hypothetical protein
MTDVLLLADQPFQLNIFANVAKSLSMHKLQVKIVLVDFFTFIYGKKYILDMERLAGCEIITAEEIFRSWQINKLPLMPGDFKAYLNKWNEEFCFTRNVDTLLATDIYTNNFERKKMMQPISPEWIKRVHYDTLKWCEEIYLKCNPKNIFAISLNLLPTNAIYELASSSRVPFYNFLDSRVQSRWVMRNDLGYGMSDALQSIIFSANYDPIADFEVEEFLQEYKTSLGGSYASAAKEVIDKFSKHQSSFGKAIKYLIIELLSWFHTSLNMIIKGRTTRNFRVRRLDQSFLKLIIFEFNRRIRPYFLNHSSLFSKQINDYDKYFYWGLHDRPEGSGLVLGDGKDEILELEFCAKNLPTDYKLLVKENPLIFGLRDRDFYRKLSQIPNVILVHPFFNSKLIFPHVKCVVGLSGTVLLEASLLGIPAWAFGKPEFLPILAGSGRDNFNQFCQNLIHNKIELSEIEIKVKKYLKFIFSNSTPKDLPLSGIDDQDLMNNNIQRITELILSKVL